LLLFDKIFAELHIFPGAPEPITRQQALRKNLSQRIIWNLFMSSSGRVAVDPCMIYKEDRFELPTFKKVTGESSSITSCK
jgi:hypothetical protein